MANTPNTINVTAEVDDDVLLAEWAAEHADPTDHDAGIPGVHLITRHRHQTTETVDLERLLPAPRRAQAGVKVETITALTDYLQRFPLTRAAVYVGEKSIIGIVDDHHQDRTGWREHRATATFTRTQAWTDLIEANGKALSQVDFAEFVEAAEGLFIRPDQATMMEIARTIQIAGERTYQSSMRLTDGSISLAYNEQAEASARGGDLKIPGTVELGIRPFEESSLAVKVAARLRTRLVSGGVRFIVILGETPAVIERRVRGEIASTIADQLGDVPVHLGTPA